MLHRINARLVLIRPKNACTLPSPKGKNEEPNQERAIPWVSWKESDRNVIRSLVADLRTHLLQSQGLRHERCKDLPRHPPRTHPKKCHYKVPSIPNSENESAQQVNSIFAHELVAWRLLNPLRGLTMRECTLLNSFGLGIMHPLKIHLLIRLQCISNSSLFYLAAPPRYIQ